MRPEMTNVAQRRKAAGSSPSLVPILDGIIIIIMVYGHISTNIRYIPSNDWSYTIIYNI